MCVWCVAQPLQSFHTLMCLPVSIDATASMLISLFDVSCNTELFLLLVLFSLGSCDCIRISYCLFPIRLIINLCCCWSLAEACGWSFCWSVHEGCPSVFWEGSPTYTLGDERSENCFKVHLYVCLFFCPVKWWLHFLFFASVCLSLLHLICSSSVKNVSTAQTHLQPPVCKQTDRQML